MESNERNCISDKKIREIFRIGHLVKTNPILWFIVYSKDEERQFEKTKPIFGEVKGLKRMYNKELHQY